MGVNEKTFGAKGFAEVSVTYFYIFVNGKHVDFLHIDKREEKFQKNP
jgi:hypothetical protein